MFSNRYISNTSTTEASTAVTMPSLDSNASIYSSDSHADTLEPKPVMILDDLDVLKLLGAGGSGKVYLVKHKVTGRLYALKVIKKSPCSANGIQQILEEQSIQAAISKTAGNFLLPLVSSWNDERNFYMVTDYIQGGDLAYEILRCKSFDARRARFYAAELLLAIENLHKLKIIHRDVKPSNILIDTAGHIILADYGFSKRFEESGSSALTTDPGFLEFNVDPDCSEGAFLKYPAAAAITTEIIGTPYAMSPEQHYACEYSYDADVWGMGITIYRMLTGRFPFGKGAKNITEMAHSIAMDPLVFHDSDGIDIITEDLLRGLLAKNARDRLTIPEIKAHPYFNDIDWFKVATKSYPTPWTPHISAPPKFPKDKSVLMAGANYPPSQDPHPQFNFITERIDFSAPLEIKAAPSVSKKPSTIADKLFGRFFTSLPAAPPEKGPAPSLANSGDHPQSFTAAGVKRSVLKPLALPKIVAGCSPQVLPDIAAPAIIMPSTPTPSTAGSSPQSSLFTSASNNTTPTTAYSLSPACVSGDAMECMDHSGFTPTVTSLPLEPSLAQPPDQDASAGLGISNLTLRQMRHKRASALELEPVPRRHPLWFMGRRRKITTALPSGKVDATTIRAEPSFPHKSRPARPTGEGKASIGVVRGIMAWFGSFYLKRVSAGTT